jgi:hypothetical protein
MITENISDNEETKALSQTAVRRSASVEVVTVPRHILLTCPHCDEELEILYNDFCEMVGEPCDWAYSSLDCPQCEKSIDFDAVDWV